MCRTVQNSYIREEIGERASATPPVGTKTAGGLCFLASKPNKSNYSCVRFKEMYCRVQKRALEHIYISYCVITGLQMR